MTKRPWCAAACVPAAKAVTLACWLLLMAALPSEAQPPQAGAPKGKPGVQVNKPGALQGYTLVFPLQSTKTYLIDMQGRVVRTWESRYLAGQEAYLLENGHLLRPAKLTDNEAIFGGAGAGGRVQEFTWDGELVWDFKFHNERQTQHHAITHMPNGNIMLIVWERKTAREFIEAGVKPELAGSGEMLVDALVEIKPSGKTGGEVVWEWHLWDHLIQDHDAARANFGDVAAHPELVDVNFARSTLPAFGNLAQAVPPPATNEPKKKDGKDTALDRLKGIGYVGAGGGRRFVGMMPDWCHVNAVAYNAKLDQIMLSPREFNEVWIIDHGTTAAEAAGHTGGRYGKGGDLLYRWGNPRAYRAGAAADQQLFSQHDAHWIPDGLPGEGHLLVFSNGGGRSDHNYSSVDEVILPVSADGRYEHKPGTAFGPDKPVWSYTAANKSDFFAPLMSGAQRLPNGNTLLCTGFSGMIFEVTPQKEIVWHYINPSKDAPGARIGFGPPGGRGGFGPPGGRGGFGGPPRSVQLFPGFLQFVLQLTPEQRKKADAFETEALRKLEALLTDAQRKQLKQAQATPTPFGRGGDLPEAGQVMTRSVQDRLKLTDDQKKQVDALQSEAKAKVEEILKDDQKKQLKEMQERMKAFAGGGRGRGGFGPGGGRGPFSGFMGGGALFRAYRYAANYPGLAGKELTPGKTIDELEAKRADQKK